METELRDFLSKDYHSKQMRGNPNIIQGFLEAMQQCNNPPKLPEELIKYLAKSYNAWHPAIALMERRLREEPTPELYR